MLIFMNNWRQEGENWEDMGSIWPILSWVGGNWPLHMG
jgi:hypothetical protein